MTNSSQISNAISTISKLYGNARRVSGRPIVTHCTQTAEIVSHYTTAPNHLISALYHDVEEDLNLKFDDIQKISPCEDEIIAKMVTTLSKKEHLNGQERNGEYVARLQKAIFGGNKITRFSKKLQ